MNEQIDVHRRGEAPAAHDAEVRSRPRRGVAATAAQCVRVDGLCWQDDWRAGHGKSAARAAPCVSGAASAAITIARSPLDIRRALPVSRP
jgi:hypothetical protein